MKPLKLLEIISAELNSSACSYVLCGGLAASLYRDRPRLTNDVDIAISLGEYDESKEFALSILKQLGAKTSLGWIPGLKERKINTMALVIGQFDQHDYEATIDILLPNLPWVENAIERGSNHKIDFKFSVVPTITIEDLILAKLFALSIEPDRFQDIDDLKSIFLHNKKMDFSYLVSEMKNLKLEIPKVLHEYAAGIMIR
jgi:hypothetical protein